jgi:hypothetical protein
VNIDIGVAAGVDLKINQGVLRECRQHVVIKRNRRGNGGAAGAIKVEGQPNR